MLQMRVRDWCVVATSRGCNTHWVSVCLPLGRSVVSNTVESDLQRDIGDGDGDGEDDGDVRSKMGMCVRASERIRTWHSISCFLRASHTLRYGECERV